MEKICRYTPIIVLFFCFLTGCQSLSEDRQPREHFNIPAKPLPTIKKSPQKSSGLLQLVESITIEEDASKTETSFFQRQKELIVATFIDVYDSQKEIKEARKRIKEGYNIDVLGFTVNASPDGLSYQKKFLENDNGFVEVEVNKKGRAFLTLSVLF